MRAAALFLSLLLLSSSLATAAPVQAAETAPPGHEGTVYFSSAAGTDGTRFFVSLLWDDMPKLFGRPAHNADRTFYPGDLLRVSVVGRMSAGYERFVLVSGAAGPKTILVGETFSVREDLQIRADAPSGLRDINFTLYPKQGRIDVTVLDENGGMGRGFFINGKAASAGTLYLDQGSYVISFEEPPENVLAPPAENITLTPGRRVSVVARYCYTADNQPPQTRVVVLENGAATYLPTLVATLRVIVVPYNPRFVVVPYLCFDEAAASSYEMPFSVFIRYDGNQYDPDNENRLSLDQRVVVDGISLEGYALWPLRSAGEQQRYHDNGDPAFLENGDPEMYRELEELRYDNGMPKYEVATITAVLDRATAPFVCFSFYAKYTRAENVKELFYSQEETCGTGPFSWLRVHGVQLEGETSIGEAKVIKFVDETENPLVLDGSNRYHKFVFSLQNQAQQWVAAGEGELSLKVSFWTTASRRQAFRAEVKWSAFSPHQAVEVNAWRLAPWAREAVEENATIVYLENAWINDERVGFSLKFVPVFGENLFVLREYAEAVGSRVEPSGSALERIREAMENAMGFLPPELRGFVSDLSTGEMAYFTDITLYSLANLDNYMIATIAKDTKLENFEPQYIIGRSCATENIGRRGISYFVVEEQAQLEGKTRARRELVFLPFDGKTVCSFDINLSGEGMGVDVVSDTASSLTLRIHAPPRSGGLQRVRIFDNRGQQLYQREFLLPEQAMFLGSILGAPAGTASEPVTLTFSKTPATPAEIYIELTNSWGVTYTKRLTIAVWSPVAGAETNVWGWLVVAGIFLVSWMVFVNWMRERGKKEYR